jgi:ubiquinol-cytochrome c reductase cytochrome b subunit
VTPRRRRRGPSRVARIPKWFDDRLGISHFTRTALDKIFPDHWSFMIGEIALYCFAILLLTGTYLTFFFNASEQKLVYHGRYVPLRGVQMSAAYQSVLDISFKVRAGMVMRQLHHWAAVVFAAAVVFHLCRVFFTGAFRRPRELNWIVGVTLLILVIFEGFAGYSLPDDLLSGTGLRIAYSIAEGIPVLGTWIASLVFGGEFPGTNIIPRLFIIHVLLIPGVLVGALVAHLAILWRQKHTDFPGRDKTEKTITGSRLWPTYAVRSVGLFCFVGAVLCALGGLAQINPVFLYGPYRAGVASSASQPDWYMGWLEGALRVFPPWEIRAFGHTVPNPFFPGVVLPGITFVGLYLWPFLEARFTRDRLPHNLLDRPRDRPLRTALGAATLAFYIVLTLAGGTDVVATTFQLALETVLNIFRVGLFVVPLVVFFVTRRICKELTRARPIIDARGTEIERDRDGGFSAVEPRPRTPRQRQPSG